MNFLTISTFKNLTAFFLLSGVAREWFTDITMPNQTLIMHSINLQMAKTSSASKAPRTQGFNRSAHSMNSERKTKILKVWQRKGKIIHAAPFKGWLPFGAQARVGPINGYKWFDNTRIIGQSALQQFQE
ncbi:Uncharacterized protein FWK35_00000371 [Aphis craccivora]|uniref:Nucleolar GTP-binding protein 2 N-terminal domain-containing protein n=1 Tax=Aphis craccivora TaxID=307492 RepID=A0A6G0ZL15_APHCR|nr:Uncharacterized protein FWK35_00000371 [Aphis craccivora]